MAELVKIYNNHDGYFEVLDVLLSKGRRQPSRNGNTIEVQDLVIEVANPKYMAPNGVRPGYNHAIGLVEGLQLIAGISDSALTAEIQPNFRAFMEDDGKFHGAYGPRARDQFDIIVDRIRDDLDTRQAVVTLWDPKFDAQGGKKDHPCTTAFTFLVRDGGLDMTTYMRSNDAWWGWPYDAVQFSMLHQTMAAVLGREVGTYTHHAVSFHLYESHWQAAKKALDERVESEYAAPVPFFRPVVGGSRWSAAARLAFDTYRVVTGTLDAGVLQTEHQKYVARVLLERKLQVGRKNLEKIG